EPFAVPANAQMCELYVHLSLGLRVSRYVNQKLQVCGIACLQALHPRPRLAARFSNLDVSVLAFTDEIDNTVLRHGHPFRPPPRPLNVNKPKKTAKYYTTRSIRFRTFVSAFASSSTTVALPRPRTRATSA